jgi:hypothetical protein
MNNNLTIAKKILIDGSYTCVLYLDDVEYHSTLRGVAPFIEFLESKKDFNGFYVADKIVGLGAAHLYVLLKVKAIWANVISSPAKEFLVKNGIDVYCDSEVKYIINRDKTGVCPIESAVKGITDPNKALIVIKETLKKLQNK